MVNSLSTNFIVANFCNKLQQRVRNDAVVWVILAFVLVAVIAAYAFYCTSKGYNFGWSVKVGFPKVWQTSVKCTT